MKRKEMVTEIGTIDLTEIDFMEDFLEVFIPVTAVSDRLKAVIDENIQKAKEEHQKAFLDGIGKRWSDTDVIVTFQNLHITVDQGKQFSYQLCLDFEDKEDESIWTGFRLDVDLSEHTTELKKLIVKAMIDKFF